jgi:hypothetical protein
MASEEAVVTTSKVAAVDLSALQFTCVILNTAGKIAAAGAGVNVYGILYSQPTADRAGAVAVGGEPKALAGAAIANAGVKLMCDATGRLVTATAGNHVVGESCEAATGAGAIFRIRITDGTKPILA